MSATITESRVIRLTARCEEDDTYIGAGNVGTRSYLERQVEQHNRYAHSEPPVPHAIAHVREMLIGYSIECVCFHTTRQETTNVTGWRCPLDRS
jgi:hypothetical protein